MPSSLTARAEIARATVLVVILASMSNEENKFALIIPHRHLNISSIDLASEYLSPSYK